jgi:hypothetical protein
MSTLLIYLLLISINSQIQDIWKPEDLWNYIKQDISPRLNTTYGLVDPNSYIKTQITSDFEDYLASLYNNFGMSVFVIIVKQLEDKKLLNDSTSITFKRFTESNFDINPEKLILLIYSVEDKGYKIVVGKNYKLKTNTGIIGDIYKEVHPYVEDKKVFIVIISTCLKIEGFKSLTEANADEIEDDDEEAPVSEKQNIKYNDTSKIFPLYFIIIILVTLLLLTSLFILKTSKRLKRLKKSNIDYDSIESLNDN